MDQRTEIREFQASRRARLTPEQAGLPSYGGHRRVPGLRREGGRAAGRASVDYYTQMERGSLGGSPTASFMPSPALCGWTGPSGPPRSTWPAPPPPRHVPSGNVAPSGSGPASSGPGRDERVPAYVRTGRLDILGINRLGHALYEPVLDGQSLPVNLARFLFLDPRASDFYVDWDKTANDAVAILRGEAGRNPL